ncbi:T9SS type A sorting domain-containing protein [candidate division KSB1 bacterium]|nr:T9SS type A sorting domain-containing protein [candidate division KSB1 bacterium]
MIILFMNSNAAHQEVKNIHRNKGVKSAEVFGIDRPFWTPNRIGNRIANNGQFVSYLQNVGAGMEWPIGAGKTINFASGIWLAGIKENDIVTAAVEYVTEFQPGKVIGWKPGSSGIASDANDPRYKVYIINRENLANPLRNPDYVNWPIADGAPIDASGKPLLLGTSTAWAVFNDFNDTLHAKHFGTKPMGVEVQMTAWAFDRRDAFGDMMFFKFKFINKSGKNIKDAYTAFWADIDIGDARDLVGCDTALSLGYHYKTQSDALYGPNPPAIGYVLLEGPTIASTARVPMIAFHKQINGAGLPGYYPYPEDGLEAYIYIQGFDKHGGSIIDPLTNQSTKFWHAGDPVAGTGWLDDRPSDKRFLMSSGPFNLADGDGQQAVVGIVIAQGKTWQESVTLLKRHSKMAQYAYRNHYPSPPFPPNPAVNVSSDTTSILLTWDTSAESYRVNDQFVLDSLGNPAVFAFQGYNLYQLNASSLEAATVIKRIAGFDVIDGVIKIRDDVFDPETGDMVNRTVQEANDTGLQRYFRITEDFVAGRTPLIRNQTYHFAVTAYAYNPFGTPKTLESPLQIITARPQSPALGTRLTAAFGDTLAVAHFGRSTGKIYPIVVDPNALTGHHYKVTVHKQPDRGMVWEVTDSTTGETRISGWENYGYDDPENFPVMDGLLVKMFGPPDEDKWSFTPTAAQWFTFFKWSGKDITRGLDRDYIAIPDEQYVAVEIRFREKADGQRAYGYLRGGTPNYRFLSYEPQHFTVWDVTSSPARQLNVAYVEQAGAENNLWDPTPNPSDRNYFHILFSNYSGDTPDPYYTSRSLLLHARDFDVLYTFWPVLREGKTMPEWRDGQVLRIEPYFFPDEKDVFVFKSVAPIRNDRELARRQAAKLVNVFPNPYNRGWLDLQHPADQFVTFTHLPEGHAKILIYTLVADLVRTIEHTNGTQFETWDLRNSAGRQVGSGIYIVHIDMGEIGQKVIKVVVF